MNNPRFCTAALVGAVLLLTSLLCSAQSFPTRGIRLVIPYAPGGAAGTVGRLLAEKMSVSIGQPVIVDHRPGGGTIIGNNLVAKATPDGYTLVMGTITSHAMLSSLSTRMPFDPEKDFAPISLITSLPFVLIAHPSVPVANVPDLVALARQQPGKLSFGSAGNGTSNHLAGELFKSIAKIDMLHVPYKGSAPALADLLGGQITTMRGWQGQGDRDHKCPAIVGRAEHSHDGRGRHAGSRSCVMVRHSRTSGYARADRQFFEH